MKQFAILLLTLLCVGCGEDTSKQNAISATEETEYSLASTDYKIKYIASTDTIYFFHLADGYGQAEDFGSATITKEGEYGQACSIRFLIEKLPAVNEFTMKIGTTNQGTNTQECMVLRGIFKLTLTGDHSATIDLINKEIGYF